MSNGIDALREAFKRLSPERRFAVLMRMDQIAEGSPVVKETAPTGTPPATTKTEEAAC